MKKFNLIQIIPSLNSGGAEQGTIDVANYLAELKNQNFIISSGGKMLQNLKEDFIQHYKLSVDSKNFFKMPFVAKKINKILIENNINILHLRSRAPAWLLPYINKKKLKTVSTFHNIYGHQNFIKKMYNKQLANVNRIVAISEYVKKEIINIYKINPNKIFVINRGTDTNFFDSNKINVNDINLFVKNNQIDLQKKIILYPGRLTEWKGQIEFLNVVESFKNEPVIFYFVGDNKNYSFHKKFIQKIKQKKLEHKCCLLGHLNKNQLKLMYHCSDIVISAPLRPEGFGRVISESLSMKKIILAYDYGGVQNQLKDLDTIYKITPFNIQEMKDKINLVLNFQEEEIINIGEIARKHIIQFFSKESMVSSYKHMYEDLIN